METFLMEMADFQAQVLFNPADLEKQKKQTKLKEKQNKNKDKRCIFSP